MVTLINVEEAAKLCGVHPKTIYRWGSSKNPHKKYNDFIDKCILRAGRKLLIKREPFEEWLLKNK